MARTRMTLKKKEMPTPYLTSFVGEELVHGSCKYSGFVDGQNGFLYGIPARARYVLKFKPKDKSFTTIGPDLGEGNFPFTWRSGVLAKNDHIYCAPSACVHGAHHRGFLKISTVTDTVEILNRDLPEMAEELSWKSGALANDNNIYFMPYNARHILKFDPEKETISGIFMGDLAVGGYNGTVMGSNNCLYGIPYEAKRIIKFDPSNPDIISIVGEALTEEEDFDCGNGVLGPDGHIYAVSNCDGRVLQINSTKNEYCWIENELGMCERGWGDPIVGVDSCIYWPPGGADCALKFDPAIQKPASFVGVCDDVANHYSEYLGGTLSKIDGVVYCAPYEGNSILAIDPFKEFSMTLENKLFHFPKKLGCLFAKKNNFDDETFYENAVRKFGCQTILTLLDKLLPFSSHVHDKNDTGTSTSSTFIKVQNKMREINCPLFITAASCSNCHLDVVYHLLRRDLQPFLVHVRILNNEWDANDGSTIDSKEQELLQSQGQKKKPKLHKSG